MTDQRNTLQADIPYHFLHEQEPDEKGDLQEINTIFLTNKGCAFNCVMCDLWKNTLTGPTTPGDIVKQIDYALSRLPEARWIKLYNNGNFFDPKSIPPSDYAGIAERIRSYHRLIVENHPKLCGKSCVQFNKIINGKLEIAMGLETVHPDVFPKLKKQFTFGDFKQATRFLKEHGIDIRVFILLNPPFLTDRDENIKWVLRSIEFAFENGAGCCAVIATRPGNEFMEERQKEGQYILPTLDALEEVFERALDLHGGRVFVDTWNIDFLSRCPHCFIARRERLEKMNLDQKVYHAVTCSCGGE